MKKQILAAFAALSVIAASSCAARAADYAPVTTDNYGRSVTVTAMPQRALTLGPNCTELFIALGLGDKITGNTLDNHSRGPLPEYAAEYARVPELNYGSATREAALTSGADFVFGIDWEFALTSGADFVFGIDWEFGGGGLDIAELEANGMNVFVERASSFDEAYGEIRSLGKIFKIEARAEEFIKEQERRMKAVADKIKGRAPLRVLVYDSGSSGVFTCSGENFESLLIERAGGENVFGGLTGKQWVTVSYEEAVAREPQVIVIHGRRARAAGHRDTRLRLPLRRGEDSRDKGEQRALSARMRQERTLRHDSARKRPPRQPHGLRRRTLRRGLLPRALR